MSTHNPILVGIDYSLPSINALKEAIRMARPRGQRILCFHIMDEEVLRDFHQEVSFNDAEIFVAAHEKLTEFIHENVGTQHEIEGFVKIGNPFEEILKMIKDHQPETLVLGSNGMKTPYFEQVGALAKRCIRRAPVEVLLIRDAQNQPFKSIGVCVDFSENSIRAAHRAARIAVQDSAQLKLIHVFGSASYKGTGISWLGSSFPQIDEQEVKKGKEKELQLLLDEISTQHGLESGSCAVTAANNVAKGLHDALRSINADLVVLGTRGRTPLKGIFLGTTAESLIQTTPCSTLAVKPEEFSNQL